MTIKEEILNEVEKFRGRNIYTQDQIETSKEIFRNLIICFNKIGRADAANVLKNFRSNESGTSRVNYLEKLADAVVRQGEIFKK